MKRVIHRYAGAALLVQSLLLAGCDATPAGNASAPATTAHVVAEIPAPQGQQRLVLAFGDSLYAGYGLDRGQSLPDAVQARLRTGGLNATVVNAGVSGDTTAAGLQRLAFSLNNLPRKPDLVLLGLGGNDVLRQLPPAETRKNMAAMLDELKARKIPVLLTGMQAPPNLGPEFGKTFNAIWPDLSREYHTDLYPFILDGVIGNPTLMLPDHVHPNAVGVGRIADRLTPLVRDELNGK